MQNLTSLSMKKPALKGLALIALLCTTTASVFAQDIPPMPRPRPENLGAANGGAAGGQFEVAALPQQQTALDAVQMAAAGADQPVVLTARISRDGPVIPNGIEWRVFGASADNAGQLKLIAKSEDPTATIQLPPGQYMVHAAYGHAQISDTLLVTPGENDKTLILEAGALSLNSAVTGDFPINPGALRYDIYASGLDEEPVPIVRNVKPGEVIHLNAGVYRVESRWGTNNATVKADIRVEPGEITEATLYHRAARVNLKLVSVAGGEAIADVDWTVQDGQGNTIYSFFGAFPTLVLAEGDYEVIAKLGGKVYNRDFEVKPGAPQDVEVLTAVYESNASGNG
ncbi:MAG: hypothetical protein H6873_10570 [Hyphomicrobiaceae bacterium]|nr:hypothetical protein [Hyphomicrobiaceae bacterium]